jgi:hypothetical protein
MTVKETVDKIKQPSVVIMQGCFFKKVLLHLQQTIIFKKMIKVTSKEIKGLKDGTLNQVEYAKKLAETYPSIELAQAFVELLGMKDAPVALNKISVSDDELKSIVDMFRVKGSSPRGRKKKVEE